MMVRIARIALRQGMPMRVTLAVSLLWMLTACREHSGGDADGRRSEEAATTLPQKGGALLPEQIKFCDRPPAGNQVIIDYASGMYVYGDVGGPIERCPSGDCLLSPLPLATFDTRPREGEEVRKDAGGYRFTMSRTAERGRYRMRARKRVRSRGDEGMAKFDYVFDEEQGIVSVSTPLFERLVRCSGRLNFQDVERLVRTRPTGDSSSIRL
jgi:hypothetical protein